MNLTITLTILSLISLSCNLKTKSKKEKNVDDNIEVLKKLPDSTLTTINYQPSIYIFDTTEKGQILKGTFQIKNTGKNFFKVYNIKSLCDCTIPTYNDKKLKPNDTLNIDFTLNTEDFHEGYNNKFINLYGNFFPYYRNLKIEVYIK